MNEKADTPPTSLPPTPSGPWLFFGLAICWTWLFWSGAAASGTGSQTPTGRALLLAGLLGPMLGGIGFSWFGQSRESRLDYWSRIVDARRIGAKWLLIVLFFVPGLMAIAVSVDFFSGASQALARPTETAAPLLGAPSTIIPFLLGIFIMGPLPEELGWRGYALDRLQARWSALASSLILGSIWALWHLPLFFIKGTTHSSHGAWSPWFWLFMVQVIAMAVVLTWIFNNTRRSTLAAILFHFMANLAYVLANPTAETTLYATLLWIAAALAVTTRAVSDGGGKEAA